MKFIPDADLTEESQQEAIQSILNIVSAAAPATQHMLLRKAKDSLEASHDKKIEDLKAELEYYINVKNHIVC